MSYRNLAGRYAGLPLWRWACSCRPGGRLCLTCRTWSSRDARLAVAAAVRPPRRRRARVDDTYEQVLLIAEGSEGVNEWLFGPREVA